MHSYRHMILRSLAAGADIKDNTLGVGPAQNDQHQCVELCSDSSCALVLDLFVARARNGM